MNTENTEVKYSGCFDGLRGLEISMTLEQAQSCSHQGDCDNDVASLMLDPAIVAQFEAMDEETIRDGLRESGAWSEEELQDYVTNCHRALWLAACDIRENHAKGGN